MWEPERVGPSSIRARRRRTLGGTTIAFATLLLSQQGYAAQSDPCSAASSVSDVRFALALKDGGAVFHVGEIIPLVLSFTSTARGRYWADVRNYDRSGRLGIETYCVEPEAPDLLCRTSSLGASSAVVWGARGNSMRIHSRLRRN